MLLQLKLWGQKPRRLLACIFMMLPFLSKAQNINLSVKDAHLSTVFFQIEQQTKFRFVYTEELLAQSKPVTLTLRSATIETAMDECMRNQPLNFLIEKEHIIIRRKKVEEPSNGPKVFRGRIIFENGEPISGATIHISGSGLSTTSNTDGSFVFDQAPQKIILEISGAEIEFQTVDAGISLFQLITVRPRLSTLDETFVIAYGKSSRRYTTGTVSSIKSPEISKQPISNPLASLTGRVPGLQLTPVSGTPGAQYIIRLRGQNSLVNGNDPLIVVDGIPYPTSSMNFFNGASVSSSPLSILNPADIESIEVLKDADATAIYGSRGANGVILITTKKPTAGKTQIQARVYTGTGKAARHIHLLETSDYLKMRREAFKNDGIIPTSTNAPDLMTWDTTRNTNWQKEFIGNSMNVYDGKVDVNGGNQLTQFLFNLGMRRESTIVPGNDFGENKFSAGLSVHHRTENNMFALSVSTSYSRNNTYLPQTDLTSQVLLAPNAPMLYTATGELNWENSTWANPLSLLRKTYRSESENSISSITVVARPVKGLEAKVTMGYSMIRSRDRTRTPKSSFDPAQNSSISAGFGNNVVNTLIIEPQISYNRNFKALRMEILGGGTIQSTTQRGISQTGTGYPSDDLLNSLRAAATVTTNGEIDIDYRYTGLFFRLSAAFKQKYLLSLNARRDGSSRYGPESRFANFGSVGASWIFSKETIFKNSKFLSFGKVKISAGLTGNDQIGDYNYYDLYSPSLFPYQGITPYQPNQLFNPQYTWEKVYKIETGIDIGLLKDRILFGINFYHNTTGNQLVQYPLPPSTGFNGILRNLPAKICNYGAEVELTTVNIQRKSFKWNTSFNLTIPRNKLLEFENLARSSYANSYVIGKPLSISKRYINLGVDPQTGLYVFQDVDRDNRISSPNDQQAIVFTGQQYYGGMQNSFEYKKISLSFHLQFVRQKNASTYLTLFGRPGILSNQPTLVMNRWQKPGDITTIQRFSNSNSLANAAYANLRLSNEAYSNASFIRLRNVYASYEIIKKKNSQLLMFLQGHNLITVTKYESIDPETKSLMPQIRMITLGIQYKF